MEVGFVRLGCPPALGHLLPSMPPFGKSKEAIREIQGNLQTRGPPKLGLVAFPIKRVLLNLANTSESPGSFTVLTPRLHSDQLNQSLGAESRHQHFSTAPHVPAASASRGSSLDMQIPRSRPRTTESAPLGWGPDLRFNQPSR